MSDRTTTRARSLTLRAALVAACLAAGLGAPTLAQQVLDICGCASAPNLGSVNLNDPATFQGIATFDGGQVVTFALPPDGVLRFESLTGTDRYVRFTPNALNTPVTILVKGNMSLAGSGCCFNINVSGGSGSSGTASAAGIGGGAGRGGYRGGDGAAAVINGSSIGGTGLGPGGGLGGTISPTTEPGGGVFFGVPELVPLSGGSGGGGGWSTNAATNCTGGGGGGGGGALLIAVNGTLSLTNYDLFADGGGGGSVGNGSGCARGGGGGSGGAIRLVAAKLATGGNGRVFARGGGPSFGGTSGTDGRIRFETIDTSAQTTFTADPAATRILGPSPIASPVQPTVAITSVGNITPPNPPAGWQGAIDVVLPAPGDTVITLATTGVPSGTTLEVKVKPRFGALPVSATVPLTSCNGSGACTASTNFNLAAGAYVVEARATFQVAP